MDLAHLADSPSELEPKTNVSSIDLSLVLACYNEGPHLGRSVQEILLALHAMKFTYELIFVDDSSVDQTRKDIRQIADTIGRHVPIQAIFHERNAGRGKAVRDGFGMAHGNVVGFIDVDLEVPAHYILPCLLAIQHGGYDVVIGKRIYKFDWKAFGLVRLLMSKGYTWLVQKTLRLSGMMDTETGYKFFRREKILPVLRQCREDRWFWDTEIMALSHLAGLSIKEVPCVFTRRFDKISSVRMFRDSIRSFFGLLRFRSRLDGLRHKTSLPL